MKNSSQGAQTQGDDISSIIINNWSTHLARENGDKPQITDVAIWGRSDGRLAPPAKEKVWPYTKNFVKNEYSQLTLKGLLYFW